MMPIADWLKKQNQPTHVRVAGPRMMTMVMMTNSHLQELSKPLRCNAEK